MIVNLGEYQIPLKLSLADGIISFIVGFPASVILVYLHNLRFVIFQQSNRLQIKLQGNSEDKSEIIDVQAELNSLRAKPLEEAPARQVEEITSN